MKHTSKQAFFILYFVIASLLINTSNTINLNKMTLKTTGPTVDRLKVAGECMKGLTKSLANSFCWKKGLDLGIIPTGCPSGYFRSLALCYEYCKPNYRHFAGLCYADCESRSWTDMGLFCIRADFKIKGKHIYVPNSLTNFDGRVPCPEGRYRIAALCYKDCNNIGMVNCGPLACSADSSGYLTSVLDMVVSTIQGIMDLVTLVLLSGQAPRLNLFLLLL
jgi:hypothetical protein